MLSMSSAGEFGSLRLMRVSSPMACMPLFLPIRIFSRPDWGGGCVGQYVTEDISPAYLQSLEESVRMQNRKRSGEKVALVV